MAKKERSLVLDIGSTALHMGEFEYQQAGMMILHAFTVVEYDEAPNEANRTQVITAALRKALDEKKFSDIKQCSLCVSGQAAFMRFVKLPPVAEEESRVRQIVEYEAKQNVPFPMEEVIWDYQLIRGETEEDLEVMFAVIKNEIVDGVIKAVSDVGLQPTLVDFAPAALYNAARANYIGENECAMLLDIGGRCTNLLFLDGPRFFARAIPIAGFSITQQIAKEFGITPEEAEILKRRHGFVALGGAYEEPESEVAATISKIVRNVMTRLHGEINRSINVYRTQQKGNKPVHMYLSGGSAIMEYTTNFFQEKLRMDVSYFNPLKIIAEGDRVKKEELEAVAHLLPQVIGTALRNCVECPVEINLTTVTIKKQKVFAQKRPYLVAASIVWLLILAVFLVVTDKQRAMYQLALTERDKEVEGYDKFKKDIQQYQSQMEAQLEYYKWLNDLLQQRYIWHGLWNALQECKPIDAFIVNVKQLEGPVIAPEGEEGPTTMPTGGGGAAGLFGGNAGFAGGAVTTKAGAVEWIELVGYTVEIRERNADGKYVRPIFTESQIEKFKTQIGEKPVFWGKADADRGVTENTLTHNDLIAPVFLKSLQSHPYFSDNEKETRFIIYDRSGKMDNIQSFRIQLKLRTQIAVTH